MTTRAYHQESGAKHLRLHLAECPVTGKIELCTFEGDTRHRCWVTAPGQEAGWVQEQIDLGRDVYLGVAARRADAVTGTALDLAYTDFLYVEVDFADFAGSEDEQREAALARIEAANALTGMPPSHMILSGGGFHLYFLITRLRLPENNERFQAANKRLGRLYGADKSVHDPPRVLRLAGTWNFKPDYPEPRPVRFATAPHTSAPCVYSIEAFEAILPPEPEKPKPEPRTVSLALASLDDAALIERIRQSKQAWKFSRLFDHGDLSGHGNDHSRADQALCTILAGWTDKDPDRIERLFGMSSLSQREKWGRRDYRDRTIMYAIGHTTWTYAPESATPRKRPKEGAGRSLPPDPDTGKHKDDCAAVQANAADSDEVEDDTGDFGSALHAAYSKLEATLKERGVKVLPCGLIFPPGIDREDLAAIGKALRRGEAHVTTVLNFLWGDWYDALPSIPKGTKGYMVRQLYGADYPNLRREQGRLSELAGIVRRIPPEHRRMGRPWSIYERLAKLSPERREYWLAQEPKKGMGALIDEDLRSAAEAKREARAQQGSQEDDANGDATAFETASSPLCVSNTGEEDSLPDFAEQVDIVTIDVPAGLARQILHLQARARAVGLTPEAYLGALLCGATIPVAP